MPRREEKKAESRRRILESARDVFFRDSFIRSNLQLCLFSLIFFCAFYYEHFSSKVYYFCCACLLAQLQWMFVPMLDYHSHRSIHRHHSY